MRSLRTALVLGAVLVLVAGVATVSAAGPTPKSPISNPFHEFGGYPGLKLGYGDALAQCQEYDNTSGANPYLPFLTSVNVIVDDPINEGAGVNQGCSTPQNETTIAVNPEDPDNLVAGANDYRDCCVASGGTLRNDGSGYVYVSQDGGATWANIKLPGLGLAATNSIFKKVTSVGDPTIAFGKGGTVYYANIAFNRVDNKNAIIVSVSRDGGLTWGWPRFVAQSGSATFFNDKVWVGADPTSGRVFISWTLFKTSGYGAYIYSRIVGSYSSDYGKTWNGSVDVSGSYLYNQGSVPVFGNDGAIYVSWDGAVQADNWNDHAIVARSTDGKNFTQQVLGRIDDESYPVDPDLGRQTLTGMRFRLNSFPALTVDQGTGRLHLVWADNSLGTTADTSSQVFQQWSDDGVTWTDKQLVTTGTADRIFPWVGAHDGHVAISYYDRAYAGENGNEIDYAMSVSLDGGATFLDPIRLTEQSSDPAVQFFLGGFIGDYTGIVVGSDDVAHPIWTDFRGSPGVTSPNQDAVTTSVHLLW